MLTIFLCALGSIHASAKHWGTGQGRPLIYNVAQPRRHYRCVARFNAFPKRVRQPIRGGAVTSGNLTVLPAAIMPRIN